MKWRAVVQNRHMWSRAVHWAHQVSLCLAVVALGYDGARAGATAKGDYGDSKVSAGYCYDSKSLGSTRVDLSR